MAIDLDRSLRSLSAFRPGRLLDRLTGAGGEGPPGMIGGAFAKLRELVQRVDLFNINNQFASLTRRIVALNLIGLVIVVGGVLYASKYQAWLIDAKRDSLRAQGEIIAAAIANSTTAESERPLFEDLFKEDGGGDKAGKDNRKRATLRMEIRPERIAPILKRIVGPTATRARIYSSDGSLILDSDSFFPARARARIEPAAGQSEPPTVTTLWTRINAYFDRSDLPVYRDIGRANGRSYPEVLLALEGKPTPMLLLDHKGRHMVSIAVPIQRSGVIGALLLSTEGGEIDDLIMSQRLSILRVALIALLSMVISSFLLARTIAKPLRELSLAAERVQRSLKSREDLPDFSERSDEIGHLSRTLRAMTATLYSRLEKSEAFAADVAHELKNPLTSVRSASETLALVKTEEDRRTLIETIQHDVRRLTRLIDDISKATRAEAEMALNEALPVDLEHMLRTVVEVFNEIHVKEQQRVMLELDTSLGPGAYVINGHDIRLGQVLNNLLDNALSFSPADGRVTVKGRREGAEILIEVEDQGPGIPPGNLEKVFKRFYTDRPGAESFGKNSGLGLSISREIILAHNGQIWAENRVESAVVRSAGQGGGDVTAIAGRIAGARFSIRLPAANPIVTRGGSRLRSVRR
ncbi:MAG: sensor histidine kinase [Hyphomicrobiaceae bacterium]